MRTIKPAAFLGTVHCSPNYLSNGHWAIRKSLVKNAGLFDNAPAVEAQGLQFRAQDAKIETQCYAVETAGRAWTVTPLVWKDGKDAVRLLIANDTGELAGISDAYLSLLTDEGWTTFEARDATSPFVIKDDDGQVEVVIMPRRLKDLGYTIARKG